MVVLERRDRAGGELQTVKRDGFLMEAGATILPGAYESVMQLVRDVGMEDELLESNSLMGFMRDGEMHHLRADHLALDAARTSLLSWRSKLKVVKLLRDQLRYRSLLSYEDLSIAGRYDVETPYDYCRRRGLDGELYDYLIEPTVRGGAGVPADTISVVEFFFLWQKVLGSKLYVFDDGYTSFVERLADRMSEVRLSTTVHEIVEENGGVRVTYEDADGTHTEAGAGAIISSMGNEVPDLVPHLAPARAQFLRDLNYTSTMSINLALKKRPDCDASFVIVPRPVSEGLFALLLEHNKAPGRAPEGKGLISLITMNQWTIDHMEATDEEILDAIMPEVDKAIPGLREDLEFVRVNRWYPVIIYSHPGLYRELGKFHESRDRSSLIHLAGSYNSSGNVNTATTAGERAARELREAMGARETDRDGGAENIARATA